MFKHSIKYTAIACIMALTACGSIEGDLDAMKDACAEARSAVGDDDASGFLSAMKAFGQAAKSMAERLKELPESERAAWMQPSMSALECLGTVKASLGRAGIAFQQEVFEAIESDPDLREAMTYN